MNNQQMKDFFDIFGAWHIPWWQRGWVKLIIWIAIAIICLIILLFILKKIIHRKKFVTAWDKAFKELALLNKSDILDSKNSRLFYFQLTEIVKQYLIDRYGYALQGSTEKEILLFLDEQVDFPKDLIQVLQDIFAHASQIKFAKMQAEIEVMKQDLTLAIRLVNETKPINI